MYVAELSFFNEFVKFSANICFPSKVVYNFAYLFACPCLMLAVHRIIIRVRRSWRNVEYIHSHVFSVFFVFLRMSIECNFTKCEELIPFRLYPFVYAQDTLQMQNGFVFTTARPRCVSSIDNICFDRTFISIRRRFGSKITFLYTDDHIQGQHYSILMYYNVLYSSLTKVNCNIFKDKQ